MGRPPIGAAAKDSVASCRLTETEKKILSARYGSASRFFRRMIDEEMQKEAAK